MNIQHLTKRIYNRLATERGSFVYNPSIGSRLHELTRAKNISEVHDLALGFIREALAPELAKKTILSIQRVRVKNKTLYEVSLEIDIIANNQQIITLPLKVQ